MPARLYPSRHGSSRSPENRCFLSRVGVTVVVAPAPSAPLPRRSRSERSRHTLSRMYRMLRLRAIAALGVAAALAALSPSTLVAQGVTTGAVTGVVTDESGQGVENAQIQVTNRATGYSTGEPHARRRPVLRAGTRCRQSIRHHRSPARLPAPDDREHPRRDRHGDAGGHPARSAGDGARGRDGHCTRRRTSRPTARAWRRSSPIPYCRACHRWAVTSPTSPS